MKLHFGYSWLRNKIEVEPNIYDEPFVRFSDGGSSEPENEETGICESFYIDDLTKSGGGHWRKIEIHGDKALRDRIIVLLNRDSLSQG